MVQICHCPKPHPAVCNFLSTLWGRWGWGQTRAPGSGWALGRSLQSTCPPASSPPCLAALSFHIRWCSLHFLITTKDYPRDPRIAIRAIERERERERERVAKAPTQPPGCPCVCPLASASSASSALASGMRERAHTPARLCGRSRQTAPSTRWSRAEFGRLADPSTRSDYSNPQFNVNADFVAEVHGQPGECFGASGRVSKARRLTISTDLETYPACRPSVKTHRMRFADFCLCPLRLKCASVRTSGASEPVWPFPGPEEACRASADVLRPELVGGVLGLFPAATKVGAKARTRPWPTCTRGPSAWHSCPRTRTPGALPFRESPSCGESRHAGNPFFVCRLVFGERPIFVPIVRVHNVFCPFIDVLVCFGTA